MHKRIGAGTLTALLALAVAMPSGQAAAMSRPKTGDEKTAAAESQATPEKKEPFIWLNNINGWNSIDDEHIVVYGGPGQAALITLFGSCYDLSYAETIAVKAPLGYLDRGGIGKVIFSSSGYGRRECPIDTLDAVKDLKEAKALVATRKAQKAMEKDGSTYSTH
jgi:hypothetical protein